MNRTSGRKRVQTGLGPRFVNNAGLLLALWIVLSEGSLSSLYLGVPFVLLAAAISVLRSPVYQRLNLMGALKFVIVFLGRIVVAGVDVARRAFGPANAIRPGFVDFDLTLPHGAPRAFLAAIVSLVPGTLSVALEGDLLRMHVLDIRADTQSEIAALEALVAGVFISQTNEMAPESGRGSE